MAIVFSCRRNILIMSAVALLVLAGKAYAIIEYAPLMLGDNSHYIKAADEILAGSAWMSDAGVEKSETPPTLYRPIAYSLLVAGAKLVAGESWVYGLTGLQALLSFGTGLLVMRLALAAGLCFPWAVAVFLLHQWSVPLSTDALVMEDALMGVLGTTALYVALMPIVRGGIPSTGRLLVAGVLLGSLFFLREVFHFCAPIIAAAIFALLLPRRGWKNAVLGALVMVVPVMLASHGLKTWNQHRVGLPIAGTGGQTAYAYALVMAMRYDPSILAGDDLFQKVLREANETYDYGDARRANGILFERYGLNSVQQLKMGEQLFWKTLATNPLPLVRAALDRVRVVQQATLFAGPLTRIDDLDWWAVRFQSGWRVAKDRFLVSYDPAELTVSAAANMGLRAVTRLVGLAGFAVFVLGVPLAWLRLRHRLGGVAHAMLIIWCLWGLFVAMYIPVSFEIRYMAPVIGPALLSVAVVLANRRHLRDTLRQGG